MVFKVKFVFICCLFIGVASNNSITLPVSVFTGQYNHTWTDWSSWSRCSSSCGHGTRSRSRVCLQQDQSRCDEKETRDCHNPTACLAGFIVLGCKCVWFSTATANFQGAVDQCAAKGADSRLLMITSAEENARILDYRRDNAMTPIYWLGAVHNISNPSEWYDYLTKEPLQYYAWDTSASQPDGTATSDYLKNQVDSLTGWHDFYAHYTYQYMCQIWL